MTIDSENMGWKIPQHRDKHWSSLFTDLIEDIDNDFGGHATKANTGLVDELQPSTAIMANTDKGISFYMTLETGNHLRCLAKSDPPKDPFEIVIKAALTAEVDDSPALIFGWFCSPGAP